MNVPPMIYMSSGRVTIAIHWPEDGKCWDELTPMITNSSEITFTQ